MPEIGEIRQSKDIGKKPSYTKFSWLACKDCGRFRWVRLRYGQPTSLRCRSCAKKMENNPRWVGRAIPAPRGYSYIKLSEDSPYYPMCNSGGYVLEHRLRMAEKLRRCLARWEIVHHKDGNRKNNELGNLELVTPIENKVFENICRSCPIRKEIRLLRWQIRELTNQLQERLKV